MRKQPRFSSAPIIAQQSIQQAVYSINYIINNNFYVTVPVTTTGTIINLATAFTNLISASGTISSITGTGPWTATLSGLTSTSGLVQGQVITATAGTGTLSGGAGVATVASIVSSTSITYTSTGGTIPTAGTVTNVISTGTQLLTATTWYLDLTNIPASVGYTTTVTVLIPQGGTSYNPTILVNGIGATLIGSGPSSTNSRVNAYTYTIICIAPNQYSYTGWAVAV